MVAPSYLQPFVLPVAKAPRHRDGRLDLYWPAQSGGERRPAIVFVHGGPIPADLQPSPRDWPVYAGYGSLAASRGVVGVTVDLRLHSDNHFPVAADDLAAAVAHVRAQAGVDPDRVALWFFSAGGLLTARWLSKPPQWLRCVAATYPILAPPAGRLDARFRPVDAVRAAGELPILVTRVGRERPEVAAAVEAFIAEAELHKVKVEVIDVPEGQHGFDMLDHAEGSRAAVSQAMTWVVTALRP
jgi:acetyl esterase/lipase